MAKRNINVQVPNGTKVQEKRNIGERVFYGALGTLMVLCSPIPSLNEAPEPVVSLIFLVVGFLELRIAFTSHRNLN